MNDKKNMIVLQPVEKHELEEFKRRVQEAFGKAVVENFGEMEEPIPSDEDLEGAFRAPDAVVYHIVNGGDRIGGVVLSIHPKTQRNSLDFFFIRPEHQDKGIGQAAWKAIEEKYPDTKIWETVTPYFEKRNIHFYVNRCGFKIVAFFNKYYPDPHICQELPEGEMPVGCDELFFFEKVMERGM